MGPTSNLNKPQTNARLQEADKVDPGWATVDVAGIPSRSFAFEERNPMIQVDPGSRVLPR